jgi:CheY-like chemotaxis protein
MKRTVRRGGSFLGEDAAETSPRPVPSKVPEMPPPPNLLPLRVLVVDDVPALADTLAMLLKLWGHEVAVFYDGPTALQAATTYLPDVVLLDVGLPGMDGCELARRLRRMPELDKCRLVAITGHGSPADRRRCEEAGIDSHFVKPLDPAYLRQLLEKLGRGRPQLVC